MALINTNTNTASYNKRGGIEYIYSKAIKSIKGQWPISNSMEADIARNKK